MKIHPGNYFSEFCKNGYTEAHLDFFKARKFHPHKINQFFATYEGDAEDEAFEIFLEKLSQTPTNDDILNELAEDVESLKAHLAPSGRSNVPPFIRITALTGTEEYQYEVYWWDITARGEVIWSRGNFFCDDILILMQKIEAFCDQVIYTTKPKPKPFKPCALYKYHPERYKQNRLFFVQCLDVMRRNTDFNSGLMTSVDAMNEIVGPFTDEMNRKSTSMPLKPRVGENKTHLILNSEMTMIQNLGMYHLCGKQIIDIDAKLCEMFKKTDVDDIPLNMIQLPFSSQYIYFGKQSDIELEGGWFFDGAYIEKFPGDNSLRITITAVPEKPTSTRLWHVVPEPMYHQRIEKADSSIDLITAITEEFADSIQRLNKRDSVELEGSLAEDINVVDVTKRNDQDRKQHKEKGFEKFKDAIKLIANAACYLSAYPEDNNPVWPDDAPANLVKKANSDDAKVAERASSKLTKLGYHKLRYYGKYFSQNEKSFGPTKKSTHWRRGHWRRQPYGPKSTLRKLKWLMPTLVNKAGIEQINEDVIGHIYSTEPQK